MSWNYRVIRSKNQLDEEYDSIHTVYYEDDTPCSWSLAPAPLVWSVEESERKFFFAKIEQALALPVLTVQGNKLVEVK